MATPDTDPRKFTQARIRVNDEGAYEVREALESREILLQSMRALAMDEGLTELIPVLNRRLGVVRRVLEETGRTITEAGW